MTRDEQLLFGERLRARRNAAGYTQEYVAEQAGITLRYYQMVERGEKNVSLDTLIRLSRVLQASTDYLLFGDSANLLHNPFEEILHSLSPKQLINAEKILTLYADACNQSTND
ncbi:MAG: helix-turn-helix transcriptional regulator [Oscillospiraceae bacterium]|nr:helix-turn-helix transcriptional regulator [Oscillospiraceae bacterium]